MRPETNLGNTIASGKLSADRERSDLADLGLRLNSILGSIHSLDMMATTIGDRLYGPRLYDPRPQACGADEDCSSHAGIISVLTERCDLIDAALDSLASELARFNSL